MRQSFQDSIFGKGFPTPLQWFDSIFATIQPPLELKTITGLLKSCLGTSGTKLVLDPIRGPATICVPSCLSLFVHCKMWVGRKQPKAKGHHLMNGSRKTKNTLYFIIFHSYLILNIGHSPQDIPNLDDRYLKVFPKYLCIISKKGFNFFITWR